MPEFPKNLPTGLENIDFPKIPNNENMKVAYKEISTFLTALKIGTYNAVFMCIIRNFNKEIGDGKYSESTIQDFVDFYSKDYNYKKIYQVGQTNATSAANLIEKIKNSITD